MDCPMLHCCIRTNENKISTIIKTWWSIMAPIRFLKVCVCYSSATHTHRKMGFLIVLHSKVCHQSKWLRCFHVCVLQTLPFGQKSPRFEIKSLHRGAVVYLSPTLKSQPHITIKYAARFLPSSLYLLLIYLCLIALSGWNMPKKMDSRSIIFAVLRGVYIFSFMSACHVAMIMIAAPYLCIFSPLYNIVVLTKRRFTLGKCSNWEPQFCEHKVEVGS